MEKKKLKKRITSIFVMVVMVMTLCSSLFAVEISAGSTIAETKSELITYAKSKHL